MGEAADENWEDAKEVFQENLAAFVERWEELNENESKSDS